MLRDRGSQSREPHHTNLQMCPRPLQLLLPAPHFAPYLQARYPHTPLPLPRTIIPQSDLSLRFTSEEEEEAQVSRTFLPLEQTYDQHPNMRGHRAKKTVAISIATNWDIHSMVSTAVWTVGWQPPSHETQPHPLPLGHLGIPPVAPHCLGMSQTV